MNQRDIGGWEATSESIDELSKAWVIASGKMVDLVKTKTANAGKYSYTYADLADVLQMARPILNGCGLAIMQTAESNADEVVVYTTLIHSSGQFICAKPTRLPAGETAQNTGSSLSYARRYALMAFLGLAAEDDDGATASPRATQRERKVVPIQSSARSDEETEIRNLIAGLEGDRRKEVREAFEEQFGCGLKELPVQRHQQALGWLKWLLDEKKGASRD